MTVCTYVHDCKTVKSAEDEIHCTINIFQHQACTFVLGEQLMLRLWRNRCLGMLRRISVRQATAYLLYLVTNASLFNLTKV